MTPKSLDGKIALITGASRGIGYATAQAFALEGATLVLNYHEHGERAEELARKLGGNSFAIQADVSKLEEVKRMFATVRERLGRLDILVNNAGVLSDSLILMTDETSYDRVLDTNLKGTYLCLQHAAKMMLKAKTGAIVNVSSIVGIQGNAGQGHYSASKAGVIGLTKSAAKELGPYGIRVNAVAPGLIDTDMSSHLSPGVRAKLVERIALGRTGTPQDVARVILFLASGESAYVSGQIIGVDGCQSM